MCMPTSSRSPTRKRQTSSARCSPRRGQPRHAGAPDAPPRLPLTPEGDSGRLRLARWHHRSSKNPRRARQLASSSATAATEPVAARKASEPPTPGHRYSVDPLRPPCGQSRRRGRHQRLQPGGPAEQCSWGSTRRFSVWFGAAADVGSGSHRSTSSASSARGRALGSRPPACSGGRTRSSCPSRFLPRWGSDPLFPSHVMGSIVGQ